VRQIKHAAQYLGDLTLIGSRKMKESINFRREITDDFERVVDRVTTALKTAGFGVLTRIDMHTKIEEKIGKKIPKVVILGACNPTMAYEAYVANSDVASLLPCNAVVRDIGKDKTSVELVKPSVMMKIIGDKNLQQLAIKADALLEEAINHV
jgi:uncharacterized protein (DUF302 family)